MNLWDCCLEGNRMLEEAKEQIKREKLFVDMYLTMVNTEERELVLVGNYVACCKIIDKGSDYEDSYEDFIMTVDCTDYTPCDREFWEYIGELSGEIKKYIRKNRRVKNEIANI